MDDLRCEASHQHHRVLLEVSRNVGQSLHPRPHHTDETGRLRSELPLLGLQGTRLDHDGLQCEFWQSSLYVLLFPKLLTQLYDHVIKMIIATKNF